MMQGNDDGPATEEQEGFECAVGQEVVHAGSIGAEATGHDHVAELADRRVGHHTFDVGLGQGDGRPDDHGDAAGKRHDCHGGGRQVIERRQSRDHEHARRDHGRGMNERRDRRRAFHGIGQPDMERHLRRFSDRSGKEEQTDERQNGDVPCSPKWSEDIHHVAGRLVRARENILVIERAEAVPDQEQAKHEAEVSDAVDEERFRGGGAGGRTIIPVADEQIGTEPDGFPKNEELQQVVRHDQHQHREGEQGDIGEEAGIARFFSACSRWYRYARGC